jgi:hypothetical protein
MRRNRGSPILVALIGLLVVAAIPLSRGYNRLCHEPVDAFYALAEVRDAARSELHEAAAETERPAPGQAGPASGMGSIQLLWLQLRSTALERFLDFKQSNQVAFPLHVVVGYALETGRCPAATVGDQWRKAAAHAWTDGPAKVAADGLGRTLAPAIGQQATVESLRRYAADEPWHAENLQRVVRLLE